MGIIKNYLIKESLIIYLKLKLEKVSSKNQYSSFKMDTSYLYNKNIKIPEETNKDFMWLMGLIMGDSTLI